jgi:hypothetical protein
MWQVLSAVATMKGLTSICRSAASALLLAIALCPAAHAKGTQPLCPLAEDAIAAQRVRNTELLSISETREMPRSAVRSSGGDHSLPASRPLIVIGFMGGHVSANNLVHREALLAKDLQQLYPQALHASVFANHEGRTALETVLELLDKNRDGCLNAGEKNAARIVIFGHSWGASETVTLARRLNELSIPVQLTIQVDSVQKANENDRMIPPNVREAVNFYQSEGLLHGRPLIEAKDPRRTTILGNFESTYKGNPVSCAGYPWYAKVFMKQHIEIENDPLVWNRIESLILREVP